MTRAFLALTPAVLKSAKYSVENILAGGSGKGCWPYLSLRSTTYYNWALICQKTWRGRDFSDPGGKKTYPLQSVEFLASTAPAWDRLTVPTCWPIELTCIKSVPSSLGELLTESALFSPSVHILL